MQFLAGDTILTRIEGAYFCPAFSTASIVGLPALLGTFVSLPCIYVTCEIVVADMHFR